MLIPNLLLLKILPVLLLIDFLEGILESTIILLENGILGAQIERQALAQC